MIKVTSGFLAIAMLAAVVFTDATISSTFAGPGRKHYAHFDIFPKAPPGYENQKWWLGLRAWCFFCPSRPANPPWK
jgi:hypothetical protein